MASEWREYRIGEIADIVGGSTPSTADPSNFDGDIPWLTPKDLSGQHDRYVSRGERNLSLKGLENCSARLLPAGTVLLTTRAPIGYVAIAKNPIATNQGFRNLVPKPGINSEFLYYWLKAHVEELQRHASGSTFQELTGAALADIKIRVPPLPEQRAIAHILGTLDDKIELNRRMSETLEQMARALFKAWFVDFEPVRAKMEGRWRRGESLPGLPAHLYDLFPDRLVPSELGEIPEGWEVKHAGKLFDIAIGKTPPRKEHHWFSTDPRDIPWMSIKDLGQAGVFISEVSEYLTPAAVERFRIRRIPDGTVVLSFKLTVGRVAITDGEMLSNEAIAHFLPREGTFLSSEYLYCYLRTFDYESLGSTSSIATAVNSDSVRAIPLLIPVSSVHDGFQRTVRPLFLRLRALQRESRTLAALRDALLPKLIRGEVRVKDAEKFLKERGL